MFTSAMTEPIAGRRRYVHGVPAEVSVDRSCFPEE